MADFYIHTQTKRARPACVVCHKIQMTAHKHNDRINAMLTAARHRAGAQGVPFALSTSDIVIPVFCPVLGLKLEYAASRTENKDGSPSLDKIIPRLGYVPGNVVVVSNRANRFKNDATVHELQRLAAFYSPALENECLKATSSPTPICSVGTTDSPSSRSLPETTPNCSSRQWKTATSQPSLSKTRSMSETSILIDGDIFCYKAAFANQTTTDLGDDVISVSAVPSAIESYITDAFERICDKLKSDKMYVTLTGPTNFRSALYGPYKGKRGPKPVGLAHAKKFIASQFRTTISEGIEADDVLGIWMTHPTKLGTKKVIVTIDKDLLQIPGRHYNPDKDTKKVVSVEEGDLMFFTQILTGDATDNYPGCKGVGPKNALRILDNPDKDNMPRTNGEMWSRVVEAYVKAGLTEDDALVQARLARILRYTDYDFNKKEPILWTP